MNVRKLAMAARRIPAGVLVLLSTLSTLPGYVPGRGSNGSMLRRDPAAMPVQFRLNDQTGPGLANITDDSDPVAAVQASLQAWQGNFIRRVSILRPAHPDPGEQVSVGVP